eukprot:1156225-Pelagomonas_calceolata.AAC.5
MKRKDPVVGGCRISVIYFRENSAQGVPKRLDLRSRTGKEHVQQHGGVVQLCYPLPFVETLASLLIREPIFKAHSL